MPVEWKPTASDRLADLYVAAPSPAAKEAVWRCVERVNARLAEDPWFLGESRQHELCRVWFHHPLVVIFDLPPGGGAEVLYVAGLRPCHDRDED
jgi:plasmid stabilization system protein ParE